MDETVKYTLDESRLPEAWYNVAADLPEPPAPVLHPGTGQPVGPDDLAPLFPMEVILQEVSAEQRIAIPEEVRAVYRQWRPTPLFRAAPPGPIPNAYYPPRMPPYAWPSYAPYNNFSRVAYPTQYPHNAFPFIGPMYPFPKVPLGWRSVQLTWEDGFWWYGRRSTGHDWWRVRYW